MFDMGKRGNVCILDLFGVIVARSLIKEVGNTNINTKQNNVAKSTKRVCTVHGKKIFLLFGYVTSAKLIKNETPTGAIGAY